ncbi:hypothetical protein [Roseicyclus sp.]|uniref:hypothetical protein n=1 Tax=Roseicyclus sp. TaxID=1914329 RepID=UPI00405417CD
MPQGFGQVFVARREQTIAVRIMAAVLCLSLIGWSMLPSLSHVPRIAETRHEHAQMIADHGHSHGLHEDLLAALHGHSHDAVDHDHSPALAVAATSGAFWPAGQDGLRLWASQSGPHRIFRIERPPRG